MRSRRATAHNVCTPQMTDDGTSKAMLTGRKRFGDARFTKQYSNARLRSVIVPSDDKSLAAAIRHYMFKSLWTSPTSPRSVMQLELRSHRREINFMDRFYFKRRRTISVAGQLPWVKLYHDQLRLRACLRNFCQLGPQCPGPRPSMAVGMSTLADMPVSDISH